jgi:hypothetical protein
MENNWKEEALRSSNAVQPPAQKNQKKPQSIADYGFSIKLMPKGRLELQRGGEHFPEAGNAAIGCQMHF